MSKTEIDKAESSDFALGSGPLRPRDAATLILLDRQAGQTNVLMGRRHRGHAFMPGKFVFPGGRTDPDDSRVQTENDLHPAEMSKLASGRVRAARARAIALSAIRETYEEAGLLIGTKGAYRTSKAGWTAFEEHGVRPALESIRFIARAVTPPGRVRRFDTRFLATWRSEVAVALPDGGPTQELEELVWLPVAEALKIDIPMITRTILEDLGKRLLEDPLLRPGGPVPYYRMLHNRFHRVVL